MPLPKYFAFSVITDFNTIRYTSSVITFHTSTQQSFRLHFEKKEKNFPLLQSWCFTFYRVLLKKFAFSQCLLPTSFWAFNTSYANGAPVKIFVYLSCCYNWVQEVEKYDVCAFYTCITVIPVFVKISVSAQRIKWEEKER